MARWNRPRFSGEQIYANTLPAPADCPKMVMFSVYFVKSVFRV